MPESYIDKDIAAKRSGRSVRRLLELAAAGKLRKEIRRDPKNGNRAIALFHAGDIARLAKGDTMPNDALQISGPVRPVAALPQGETGSGVPAPVTPRLWLTVAEAADYSGLPAGFLVHLVAEKKLPALDVGRRPGGHWRIARRDLDDLRAE